MGIRESIHFVIEKIDQKGETRSSDIQHGKSKKKSHVADCNGRPCANCKTFMVHLCKRITIGDAVFSLREWRTGVYLKSLLRR